MNIQQKLIDRQKVAAERYNQHAKAKTELHKGQSVRVRNKQTKRWEPAVVSGKASTPRSYFVQRMAGGGALRRNRVHIRPIKEVFTDQHFHDDDDTDLSNEDTVQPTTTSCEGEPNRADEQLTTPVSPTAQMIDGPRRGSRSRKQTVFYQAGI